ncbi:hypothetical protein CERSUDRAFT_124370 [Gelatoporia subvermispora B]|uniref:Uncharacterized protein n=1 Tax=Ceriporiopsis subvermispora (strain B) TaxID=914234 RepID=M2RDU9_CERS8|nr:hypothetical protein CERSUDRAFT_124370 [Gelatoporia subvermispora B]
MSTPKMKLNADCLYEVISWLPTRSDVLAMALSCGDVYQTARGLLRYWHVHICEETADAMSETLHHEFPSRFQYIRELTLDWCPEPGAMAFHAVPHKAMRLAAKILRHAHRLETLRCPTLYLSDDARTVLTDACWTTPAPRHLYITAGVFEDWAIVGQMQGPVTALHVRATVTAAGGNGYGDGASEPAFVFPDLSRFAETLQELDVGLLIGHFRMPSSPCRMLHKLTLLYTPHYDVRTLAWAFPNLRELMYTVDYTTLATVDEKKLTAANLSVQETGAWPLLDTITSNVRGLEILNWRRQLKRLNILCGFRIGDFFQRLLRMVRLVAPLTLSVSFWSISRYDKVELGLPFARGSYAGVENLIIDMPHCDVEIARRDRIYVICHALTRMFPSATHIIIRVRFLEDWPLSQTFTKRVQKALGLEARSDMYLALQGKLGIQEFVLRLAKDLSSLRFAYLEIGHESKLFWKIDQGDKRKAIARELAYREEKSTYAVNSSWTTDMHMSMEDELDMTGEAVSSSLSWSSGSRSRQRPQRLFETHYAPAFVCPILGSHRKCYAKARILAVELGSSLTVALLVPRVYSAFEQDYVHGSSSNWATAEIAKEHGVYAKEDRRNWNKRWVAILDIGI